MRILFVKKCVIASCVALNTHSLLCEGKKKERNLFPQHPDEVEARDKKFNFIPIVYEPPCAHIASFGCCASTMTVYKNKVPYFGQDRLTHKLVVVQPADGKSQPFVMQLLQGKENLRSSGTKMECLKCAKFNSADFVKEEVYTGFTTKESLRAGMLYYGTKVGYYGFSKCNCQSFVHFIVKMCGATPSSTVVETREGKKDQIDETVLALANSFLYINTCIPSPIRMASNFLRL
jgi:hypothetical protein